jgi:hypothetical protein
MAYFLLQAHAFLLVKFEDPVASGLLRGMFDKCYLALAIAGAVGVVAFGVGARLVAAAYVAAVAAFAMAARRWFLHRMDAELRACETGEKEAVQRLRRLH